MARVRNWELNFLIDYVMVLNNFTNFIVYTY